MFAALTLISAASTYALHTYMIGRLDAQLRQFARDASTSLPTNAVKVLLPADYYVTSTSVDGVGDAVQLLRPRR